MLVLTKDDLVALTGKTQPAAQVRWLKAGSWVYVIGADGLPKVAIEYFNKRMVEGTDASDPASQAKPTDWQVDTMAVRSAARRAK